MKNGKVQAEQIPVRKSRITKTIQRLLSTAKFENITITEQIEEEIEWKTLEERSKKIDNWNTILLSQYKETEEAVLNELGLEIKKAYFSSPLQNKQLDSQPVTVSNIMDELN